MKAGEILTEAARIVEGSRQQTHGDKERSFDTIAAFWNTYLSRRGILGRRAIEAMDVAAMMTLLKLARAIEGDTTHPDHYVDGSGYLALAGEIAGRVVET